MGGGLALVFYAYRSFSSPLSLSLVNIKCSMLVNTCGPLSALPWRILPEASDLSYPVHLKGGRAAGTAGGPPPLLGGPGVRYSALGAWTSCFLIPLSLWQNPPSNALQKRCMGGVLGEPPVWRLWCRPSPHPVIVGLGIELQLELCTPELYWTPSLQSQCFAGAYRAGVGAAPLLGRRFCAGHLGFVFLAARRTRCISGF